MVEQNTTAACLKPSRKEIKRRKMIKQEVELPVFQSTYKTVWNSSVMPCRYYMRVWYLGTYSVRASPIELLPIKAVHGFYKINGLMMVFLFFNREKNTFLVWVSFFISVFIIFIKAAMSIVLNYSTLLFENLTVCLLLTFQKMQLCYIRIDDRALVIGFRWHKNDLEVMLR